MERLRKAVAAITTVASRPSLSTTLVHSQRNRFAIAWQPLQGFHDQHVVTIT